MFTLWASVVGVATFAIFQVPLQVRDIELTTPDLYRKVNRFYKKSSSLLFFGVVGAFHVGLTTLEPQMLHFRFGFMSGLWLKQKQRMIDHWVGVHKYSIYFDFSQI